jgi:hypothetical protein
MYAPADYWQKAIPFGYELCDTRTMANKLAKPQSVGPNNRKGKVRGVATPLEKKSTSEEIRACFDQDVEGFSNLETGNRPLFTPRANVKVGKIRVLENNSA